MIVYRKLSYRDLRQEMSISEVIRKEAVQGELALTRGQWIRLAQLLRLPKNLELQTSERNGVPCWESVTHPSRWERPRRQHILEISLTER